MSMSDSKLSITSHGNVINGVMNSVQSAVVESRVIRPTKYRSLIKIRRKTVKAVLGGREVPQSSIEEQLLYAPLIFERMDGKWTARPEKGKLNMEQKKELEEWGEKENKKAPMYGYKARKVGEFFGMWNYLLCRDCWLRTN